MKKFVSFALLLGSLFLANVQGQIGFIHDGHTYVNGDSITAYTTTTPFSGIALKNTTSDTLRDLVVTIIPIEEHGMSAWGVCAGGFCVASLTSNKFRLNAGATDDMFAIDYETDPNVANPYGIYTIRVRNSRVNCSVKVRINIGELGIGEAATAATLLAFPNPAQGSFAISYEVGHPSTLVVTDMQGRTVRELQVEGCGTAVVDNLPAGIYAYGIQGNSMKKLIVK